MTHPVVKTVYLVRHGQSTHNTSPVFQSVNSSLSDQGIRQAKALAERLSHVPLKALLASPVLRAKQTAKQIADKTGHGIQYSELFVERVKPTSIDGQPYTDPAASQVWRKWNESLYTPDMRVEDGENYDDLIARADRALQYLLERPETSLAVVTHGWFLRVMVARILLGDDISGPILQRFIERASIENTAVTVLQYRNGFEEEWSWRLWTLNDHAHFAE